jgi:ABC-type lipoprotein export system ATPase subunit
MPTVPIEGERAEAAPGLLYLVFGSLGSGKSTLLCELAGDEV